MRNLLPLPLLVLLALPAAAADRDAERFANLAQRLVPLHRTKGPVQPGDWLEHHPEDGQTFAQWQQMRRNLPTAGRRTIVVQPIGAFPPAHAPVQAAVDAFLVAFFGLPVRRQDALALTPPATERRVNEHTGQPQWRSRWLIDELRRRRPADAVAVLGLTATDLWPGDGWNFVFGEAMYLERVGVWSLARYGDPATEPQAALRRSVAIALHETGHMFTIAHCTAYECLMGGSNSLRETDRAPLDACPECTAKIWSLVPAADPAERYRRLAGLAEAGGLAAEAAHWRSCAAAVAGDP